MPSPLPSPARASRWWTVLRRTAALIGHTAPGWGLVWALLLVAQGLLPLALVLATRRLVDAVGLALHSGAWTPIEVPGAALAAVLLAMAALSAVLQGVRAAQSHRLQDEISARIQRQSAALELSFFESAEFFDRLHLAREQAAHRPAALLEGLSGLATDALTLLAMLAFLARFSLWMPLTLAAATLPALAVVLAQARRRHRRALRIAGLERRAWYYDWLLTAAEPAQELRLFELARRFRGSFRDLRARIWRERLSLARSEAVGTALAALAALALCGGAGAVLLRAALRGAIGVGSLAAYGLALQQGLRLTQALLEHAGEIFHNSLFLEHLFEFFDLPTPVASPPHPKPAPAPLREGVRFHEVGYRYPGAARPALDGVSLLLPAGKITALVGANGAGKSTLIKLLCRFCDPLRGAITVDGIDLRDLALPELRGLYSAAFQRPVHYNAPLLENLTVGLSAPVSIEEMQPVLAATGVDALLERLPRREHTLLGHWFESGVELSAGEWQRLALARALARPAPILILDEPTGNLDPWAEAQWRAQLPAWAAGRTVLIGTHRLALAETADLVVLLEHGGVAAVGSHDELLARGGAYAVWCGAQLETA